jgi:hypothetical protein
MHLLDLCQPSKRILITLKASPQSKQSTYSVCPFVCIGSPHPLHRKRVCLYPQDPSRGGDPLACGKGVGEANADEGKDIGVLCILIRSLRQLRALGTLQAH